MSESTAELKPCPFCGYTNADPDASYAHDSDQGTKWGFVVCGGCGGKGPEVRTHYHEWPVWKQDAIAAWNRRAND